MFANISRAAKPTASRSCRAARQKPLYIGGGTHDEAAAGLVELDMEGVRLAVFVGARFDLLFECFDQYVVGSHLSPHFLGDRVEFDALDAVQSVHARDLNRLAVDCPPREAERFQDALKRFGP